MAKNNIKNLKLGKSAAALLVASTLALNMTPMFKEFNTKAETKKEEYVMQNDYVETSVSVNMRTDNNFFGEIICKIKPNEKLRRILSCDNEWDLIIYKDRIGFVSREFVEDIAEKDSDFKIDFKEGYAVSKDGVNLRLGPSTNDKIIGSVSTDEIAEVLGKTENNWYLVLYNGKIGYVSGDYIEYNENINFARDENNESYIYSAVNVNFREEPSLEAKKITLIPKNETLEFLSQEDNGWFKVRYNGVEGYVSGDFITFNPPGEYRDDFIKVVYATEDIDLKKEPVEDSDYLYVMNKFETCEVLGEENDYYLVRCANRLGYIPKDKAANLYNTFVVIDINSQKLTLYRNNQILVETDIVTGQKYQYDTPLGMYSIRKKETDTFLSGYDYFTHVNYWMPFNGGIGMHDAEWRRKFGSTIYERDGSHGCVNIPLQYTDDIYYNVKSGTKVLVQK